MKHNDLHLGKILKFLTLFALISMFASCNSDDDTPPTPIDEEVAFRVDLLKIAALEIKEAEDEMLEIYGTISSKLRRDNITEDNTLWSVAETEAIGVGVSDTRLVSSVTYTIASSKIAAGTIEVAAHLFDYDGGGDNPSEDLGNEKHSTPLSNITTSVTYQIVLNDSSGQTVQLTYSITRL